MNVLTGETIKMISFFEKKTRARVKECFIDKNEKLTFLIEQGDLGKALGKKAQNLRDMEKSFNRKIRIAEFAPGLHEFITNLVAPLTITDIEDHGEGLVVLRGKDEKTNGLLIGKRARNLRNLEWMVQKYFPEVKEIKVY